ncbi:MAG: hypothetical protein OMOMHJEC_03238 [Xanthomonadales bacterium]|nr:hypothetical protein [Xanthomonadales bacterium]
MSIAVITSYAATRGPRHGLPREVLAQLVRRASQAGKTIAVCGCHDADDLLECVGDPRGLGAEFLLVDARIRSPDPRRVEACLQHLGVPWIEVDADPAGTRIAQPQAARVVDGYGSQGYVLAMSMALEQLGCAEYENDVHVGT